MLTYLGRLLLILTVLTLSGCKEVLYSELDQTQVNDMVAILEASNIETTRSAAKDGLYSLSVKKEDIAKAVVVLRERGFPRERFAGLGDIFQSEGIMGTPFEQHVRFIHAMNEELSGAISSISGVRTAKVLVTLPLPKRYDREPIKASASVTVHTQPDFNIGSNISKLKRMVSSAVPNLAYDDVTISSFPASNVVIMVPQETPAEILNVEGNQQNQRTPLQLNGGEWSKRVTLATAGAPSFEVVNMPRLFWSLGLCILLIAALCLALRLTRKPRQ